MFFSELKHEITMLVIRTLFLSQILVSLKPTKTPQRKKIRIGFQKSENFDVKKVTQRNLLKNPINHHT